LDPVAETARPVEAPGEELSTGHEKGRRDTMLDHCSAVMTTILRKDPPAGNEDEKGSMLPPSPPVLGGKEAGAASEEA